MKKSFQFACILTVLLLTGIISYSQEKNGTLIYIRAVPEWVPSKGYWVVESNKKTPRQSIIYFYNEVNVLIYKENVEKRRLRVHKDKVKFHLKEVLETAMVAWKQKHTAGENNGWVAAALRK